MNFTTIPNISNSTKFLIYGDSRTQRTERRIIAQKISESILEHFDFSIHTGDIVEDRSIQAQWNNYFMDTEVVNGYKPAIFVEGNHERGENTKMYENLVMNSTAIQRYYAFIYNNIGFIILNSNYEVINDDLQTGWLNETLNKYSQQNSFNLV